MRSQGSVQWSGQVQNGVLSTLWVPLSIASHSKSVASVYCEWVFLVVKMNMLKIYTDWVK